MIKDHHHDLAEFITSNERGKHLPAFLCKVAGHLTSEQDAILKELKSLSAGVEHINNIVATQQSYAKTSNISEEIDCAALLDQVVQLQVGALERRGIEVIREFTGHPLINADKHKMLQILLNLVRNASHAMLASDKKDRRLTLRLRSKDENAYIEVADNGIGIESENLTKVFSHGFTTKKDGHGFGLHSAALAAQDMGGSLNVHSDGPGLGATFILQIPIQDPNSPPIEKANGRSAETTRQPHHARNHKE
jgi:signal transduction histidine kinase